MTAPPNPSNAELDRLTLEHDAREGERLLQAVYDFLGRFVSFPSEHAHIAHALWCVHAHLMRLWDTTARLAFLSPEPASGKSRALEVTELLVPNPVMAVNVSPAYLFRKIGSEDGPPTVLFDEIDTVFGPKAKENEEIRGLLNAGHRRGATAGRCVVHGKTVPTEEIPAYSAVALAGLGWLPDTIMSRSVVIYMRRRHAGERIEPFRRRIHGIQGCAIRRLVENWAQRQPDDIDWPELPPGVEDRDADVWESLIAVADMAGGDWPVRARAAAVALVSAAKEAEPSLGIRLLADTRIAFGDAEQLATTTLIHALRELPESPWNDLKGRPLDERRLAARLRQYGIKPRVVRIGGATPRGYRREDFVDAWERYLLPLAARSATTATGETIEGNQLDIVADTVALVAGDVANGWSENIKEIRHVADVALVADFPRKGGEGSRRCAQCGGAPDGAEEFYPEFGEWLHPVCFRFWRPRRWLWFYPTIGAAITGRAAVAHVLLPGLRAIRLGRPAHSRPSSGRGSL